MDVCGGFEMPDLSLQLNLGWTTGQFGGLPFEKLLFQRYIAFGKLGQLRLFLRHDDHPAGTIGFDTPGECIAVDLCAQLSKRSLPQLAS